MDPDLSWQSLLFGDGSLYEGLTKDGKAEDHGVMLFSNRDRYEGQFVDGRMDGFGVYIWNDGTLYRGEWTANHIHGCGVRIRRGPPPERAIQVAEGKHLDGSYVGPVMPCGVEEATDAAIEADVAASQARTFLTAKGKTMLKSWKQQAGTPTSAAGSTAAARTGTQPAFALPAFSLPPLTLPQLTGRWGLWQPGQQQQQQRQQQHKQRDAQQQPLLIGRWGLALPPFWTNMQLPSQLTGRWGLFGGQQQARPGAGSEQQPPAWVLVGRWGIQGLPKLPALQLPALQLPELPSSLAGRWGFFPAAGAPSGQQQRQQPRQQQQQPWVVGRFGFMPTTPSECPASKASQQQQQPGTWVIGRWAVQLPSLPALPALPSLPSLPPKPGPG